MVIPPGQAGEPLSELIFAGPEAVDSEPWRFSPDVKQVAGERQGKLTTAEFELEARRAEEHAAPVGQFLEVDWSPDSQWLYLKVRRYGGIVRPTGDYALRIRDGKLVVLSDQLGVIAPPEKGDEIRLIAASWLPGPGHRLLVLAHRREGATDLPRTPTGSDPVRERRWLIQDVDAATTEEVAGLPDAAPGLLGSLKVHVSPDGRYVGFHQSLYDLSPGP